MHFAKNYVTSYFTGPPFIKIVIIIIIIITIILHFALRMVS